MVKFMPKWDQNSHQNPLNPAGLASENGRVSTLFDDPLTWRIEILSVNRC